AEGRIFTDNEARVSKKVCVIGQTVARELFEGESALGKEINVGGVSLKILGILDHQGVNEVGFDQDDVVLLPLGAVKQHLRKASQPSNDDSVATAAVEANRVSSVEQILARVDSAVDVQNAKEQITALLRKRHRLRMTEPDDFNVRDMSILRNAIRA